MGNVNVIGLNEIIMIITACVVYFFFLSSLDSTVNTVTLHSASPIMKGEITIFNLYTSISLLRFSIYLLCFKCFPYRLLIQSLLCCYTNKSLDHKPSVRHQGTRDGPLFVIQPSSRDRMPFTKQWLIKRCNQRLLLIHFHFSLSSKAARASWWKGLGLLETVK